MVELSAITEDNFLASCDCLNNRSCILEHGTCEIKLMNTVLRGEWGFCGMVITDFVTSNSQNADRAISQAAFPSRTFLFAGLDVLALAAVVPVVLPGRRKQ